MNMDLTFSDLCLSFSERNTRADDMYEYRILFPKLGSLAIRRELDPDAPHDVDRRRRGDCVRPVRQPRRERA